MSDWRMFFLYGNRNDLISDTSNRNSLGNQVYIMLVEHTKANFADFFVGDPA